MGAAIVIYKDASLSGAGLAVNVAQSDKRDLEEMDKDYVNAPP